MTFLRSNTRVIMEVNYLDIICKTRAVNELNNLVGHKLRYIYTTSAHE